MDAERARLAAADRGEAGWRLWGALRLRTRLGHRARGLQRRRRRLGFVPVRARAVAGVPLERGRARRDLRREPAVVFRVRLLERPRPDREGAHLRADRSARQPRRGRQGALVVRRLDADALVDAVALPLPAARVPLRRPARGERAAYPQRPGVRARRHRRTRAGVLGHRRRLREGNSDRHRRPADRAQRGPRAGPTRGSADPVVPKHLGLGPDQRSRGTCRRPDQRYCCARPTSDRPGRRSAARRAAPDAGHDDPRRPR